MSVETDFAISNEDTGTNIFSDHPSYLIAADAHTVGNDQGSMLDPTTWLDKGSNVVAFTLSAGARAVTSAYNIVPEIGNFFGGEFEQSKLDTEQILRSFDDNLGNYYTEHKTGVDIVGDIVGSFVPGMAGIKILNWGQRALKLVPEGNFGYSIAKSLGTLPDKSAEYAARAAVSMSQDAGTYTWVNANMMKSVAAGYAQNALEFGIFEVAAASTMRDSPLFRDETAGDIMYNAILGGGFIGAGVIGTAAAIKTYGGIKKALIETDIALYPSKATKFATEATEPSDKVIVAQHNIEALPILLKDDPLYTTKLSQQQKTIRVINNEVRTNIRTMSTDDELGNILADNIQGVKAKVVLQNMLGAKEVVRAGENTAAEIAANKAAKEVIKAGTKDVLAKGILFKPNASRAAARDLQAQTDSTVDSILNPTLRYLKLSGEDAGVMFSKAPPVLYLGDTEHSAEGVTKAIKSYNFSATKPWNILAESVNHTETEARTIWIQKLKELPATDKLIVDKNDIPLLERLYQDKISTVVLTDGTTINGSSDLLKHITETKNRVAWILKTSDELSVTKKTIPRSTTEIAKFVNVRTSYLEGAVDTKNPAADLFAMQSASVQATILAKTKELTYNPEAIIDTLTQPRYAKISYDAEKISAQGVSSVSDRLIDGVTYIKQLHAINQVTSDIVFSNYVRDKLPLFVTEVPERLLALANRFGAGAKGLAAASASYDSLGATMEYIGKGTATLKRAAIQTVDDTFSGHFYKFSNDSRLGLELSTLRQQMLSTPEKYILRESETGGWEVIARKLAEWEETGAEGTEPIVDAAVKSIITVSDDMAAFLKDWVAHNDIMLNHKGALLNAKGKQIRDLTGNIYFPQPNPKDYKHFAMIIDPTVSGTGHKSLITGATEEAVQQQAKKVAQNYPELKILFKKELEENKLAIGSYDFNQSIHENYIDIAKQRSGVAPFFPNMNASDLTAQLREWRTSVDVNLTRDMVALKYERAFTELQRMGKQTTLESTSQFNIASIRKYAENTILDPYNNYVKTALDISKSSEYKLWQGANDLAENAIGGLMARIHGLWDKVATPKDLETVNTALKEAGINTQFEDAMTLAYAGHSAPKPYLSNFIRGANSVLSTLMLRADPGNAMNNGIGSIVLTGAETKDLLAKIATGDVTTVGRLAEIAKVKLPGTGDSYYSTTKLIAGAYKDWWKAIGGGESEIALKTFYKEQGWSTNLYEQFKNIADTMSLEGNETAEQLHSKLLAGLKNTGDFLSKYSGNNFAEEMNRFVSSNIAQKISQVGVDAKILTLDDQKVFINSFVNRTQGNYLASQRPIAFQGPIGQAIGLFQTYQFNMMQHIFRRVAEGNNKNLAILMGLQGTIYGINGLPAVNAINDHLIGNAAGNVGHRDLFSTVGDVTGKDTADWLMYGFASNFLLHPDLKMNLYSRGDINPRQVTVIPTQLQDIPIISASATLFTALKNSTERIAKGGDVYSNILQGFEHAGVNRPLAGLATVLEGAGTGKSYSTTVQGQLVMSTDILSLANLSRIVGAKPLDEAIARDAMYRVKVYAADRQKQINTIGAAIKSKILAGDTPTTEELNNFLQEYVKAGGSQNNFNKFIGRIAVTAKTSQVNKIAQNLNNPFSQYMQRVMGGYELEDMTNAP